MENKQNLIDCLHKCDYRKDKFEKVAVDMETGWAWHYDENNKIIHGGFPLYKECCHFKDMNGTDLDFSNVKPSLKFS